MGMRLVLLNIAAGAALMTGIWEVARGVDQQRYNRAIDEWRAVLQQFVDERGRVDFKGLRARPGRLDSYLDYVAVNGPLAGPECFDSRAKRLAYYLNAYNALAMRKVVDFGVPQAIAGFRKLRFFALSRIRISGRYMSLYTLENKYIRSEGEPRIHFALNCMAVSCPRLPREPFDSEMLEEDLDALAQQFFTERRNLYVDHHTETVHVSEILEFFTGDFLTQADSLVHYINRYVEPDIPQHYTVEFIDYDWSVNSQARPQ